jgi:hypothetical protein
MRWFLRKTWWNFWAWLKFAMAKPRKISAPPDVRQPLKPVSLSEVIPDLPIEHIRAVPPEDIPSDERSRLASLAYRFQVWLYSALPPMQPGLPPIEADPVEALKRAYTRPRKSEFGVPALPAEFLTSPDLGSLAVRGPYACYTQLDDDGTHYKWEVTGLDRYRHHEGLYPLGAKVLFEVEPKRRALRAVRIDTAHWSSHPDDRNWELAKKIALCTMTTHLSLVRHFNWTHLACAAHLAVATRNCLPSKHALCRLLWPYIFATQQSNDIVARGQMVKGGDFESIFSFSFEGMCSLFDETYQQFRMVVNDPEEDAKRRRIHGDERFDQPTQANLEALFDVMHQHAKDYLALYYRHTATATRDDAIRNDAQIRNWLNNLNELIPNGAGCEAADVTFDRLARLVAQCIYLVTAQHELLGSFLWNYQLWTHRQPVRVYVSGQREPLDVYQRLVNANYNLNVRRCKLLVDFSELALDPDGACAFRKFGKALRDLQARMEVEPWTPWKLYPSALKVNINA